MLKVYYTTHTSVAIARLTPAASCKLPLPPLAVRALRLGGSRGRGASSTHAHRPAQLSANGPTYYPRPYSCFRLRYCRFADLPRRPACRRTLWELERTADRYCSGPFFT